MRGWEIAHLVEEQSRWARLLPLVLATMTTQASLVVMAPILVEIGHEFGASVGAVGQARTINAAVAVAGSLAAGPLIDRVGVRAPLLWGSCLAVLGAVVAAASPSLSVLYAAQILTGLGVAGMLTAGFAGVASEFRPHERVWAIGYVIAGQSLAWTVGIPIMGGLAALASWRAAFAVPILAGIATALTAAFVARDRRWRATGTEGSRGLRAVLANESARNWAVAELVAYAAWTSEITYIGAFYITTYGLGPAAAGALMAVGSTVFAVTTLSTARLLRRFDRRLAISVASLGMGVALPIGFNVSPGVGFTLAVFCGMAFCAGIRSTASSSLGLAQLPGQPGSMMASRTAAAQFGYVLGAACGGILIDGPGFGTLGAVLSAVMVVAALLVMRVHDPGTEGVGPLPEAID